MRVNYPLNGLRAADNYLEQLSFIPEVGSQKGSAMTGGTSLVSMAASLDIMELLDWVVEILLLAPENADGTRNFSAYEMDLLMTALRTARKGGLV